jgi:transposase-like protein
MTIAKKTAMHEIVDQLLADYQKPEEHGLLKHLIKAVVERALQAEMESHLGHTKNS